MRFNQSDFYLRSYKASIVLEANLFALIIYPTKAAEEVGLSSNFSTDSAYTVN